MASVRTSGSWHSACRNDVHDRRRRSSSEPFDVPGFGWSRATHLPGMSLPVSALPLVGPDFGAVGGSGQLRAVVGALLTYGLIIAVLMVVISAAAWAIGSAQGSWQTASKAKTGLFVALGGALLTGGALAWANWLLSVGASL